MSYRVRHVLYLRRARVALAFAAASAFAADGGDPGLQQLIEQNRRLQEQVREQQRTIDAINAKIAGMLQVTERQERELKGLTERVEDASDAQALAPSPPRATGRETPVRISAEVALTYFRTERDGQFPSGSFRIDDPMIAIEAPVWKNVYVYTELKLLPRETNNEDFQLGEIYIDFEDVLGGWGRPGLLNVRAGRLNIPFGEEYLVRGPLANPLISHSLSDTWGCDEGVEIYGRIGPANYVVAVQNGGESRLRDFDSDKSVAARVDWQPARWLHVSGSAMRTGDLSVAGDSLSELWFGNGFFRGIGATATTTTFWANLMELDATARWRSGHVRAAYGVARYDDNDTAANNARRLRYGSLEAMQELAGPLFAAARYSEIRVPGGYPLPGWAPLGAYFFRPGVLTEELRRLSVGVGYRFGPPLVLKAEYTWESGRMTTGASRNHENFFGTQLGVKF